jgi:uncharacterized protein (DUF2062 family)
MPKNFIKKYMPDHQKIKEHKHLKIFGTLLHDANIWHLNRRSVSGAFAVGLFCAWIPIPSQMVLAAAIAIIIRVNLPISVALVWISNPITMPPLFYAAYRFGAYLMGQQTMESDYELTLDWFSTQLDLIWQPFLLGCFVFAVASGLIGFLTIRILWRMHIIQHMKERRARLHNRAKDSQGKPSGESTP